MSPLELTPSETALRSRTALRTRGRIVVEAVVVLVAYAVVAVVATWPIARSLGSTVLGVSDSDSGAIIWWLDVLQRHGFEVTGTTHFGEVAAPFGSNQSNAINIQWAWPFFPAYLLTKAVGAVAAYNLTLLTGLTFSGAAMYALARKLGVSSLIAGWAGIAYLLFPWHLERAISGHASLIHVECFPLLALALVALAERRDRRRLALLAVTVLLCWLTSGYYGVMAVIVVAVAATSWAVCERERRQALKAAAVAVGVGVVVSLAVVGAALAGGGDGGVGQARSAQDVARYGIRPLELVVPAAANPLFRRFEPVFWEGRKHGSNIQETSNYLGWVTLGLALLWLVLVRRTTFPGSVLRTVTTATCAVGVVALALALPGRVDVFGVRFSLMPSRLLYEVIPAFRVPSRWTTVIFLTVTMLATLGLAELVRLIRERSSASLARYAATGVVVIAVVASATELRITHPGVNYDPSVTPPEYELLKSVRSGALAEYPLVEWENTSDGAYVLAQRQHGRPLVNVPPSPWRSSRRVEGIRRSLVDPTAPGVAAKLSALGATAIVTRPDTLGRALELPLPENAPRLGAGFALVGTSPDQASVWRVTAVPAPAVAYADTRSFSRPLPDTGGRIAQDLRGPEGSIRLTQGVGTEPKGQGVLRFTLYARGAALRRVTVGGRRVTATAVGTPVGVPVTWDAGGAAIPVHVAGLSDDDVGVAIGPPWVEH